MIMHRAYANPELVLDGIFRTAAKPLHSQVLLDPPEGQSDLPTTFSWFCDDRRWQFPIVGQEPCRIQGLGSKFFAADEDNGPGHGPGQ